MRNLYSPARAHQASRERICVQSARCEWQTMNMENFCIIYISVVSHEHNLLHRLWLEALTSQDDADKCRNISRVMLNLFSLWLSSNSKKLFFISFFCNQYETHSRSCFSLLSELIIIFASYKVKEVFPCENVNLQKKA